MPPALKDSEINACFEELIADKPNINKYKKIIDKYLPIHFQPIPPLKMISNTGSSSKIAQQKQLQDQFYQEKFVPSPDLLINYQKTFIKSLRAQQPSSIVNQKLVNLYQSNQQVPVNPFAGKQNHSLEPMTLPYKNISNQYNYQPPRAENKHIFVEEREEIILKELKDKQKFGLEMSIPVIEKSLMENQIRNLEMKNISMENVGKLSVWKEKRGQVQSMLKGK